MVASQVTNLGDFLRIRRSQLRPSELGVPEGSRRRVPGLRREEVSERAGVSSDYYRRLEQGRVRTPSAAVLGGIARALTLSPDETEHMFRLVQPPVGVSEPPRAQAVRPSLLLLIEQLSSVPALVIGRRLDVLARNSAAAALFGTDHGSMPGGNVARSLFLDPAAVALHRDWEECARENVARLRFETGLHPNDRELAALVRELAAGNASFRYWWDRHPVEDKTAGRKLFRHPIVGDLDLEYDTLRLADDPEQSLVTYTVEPGSVSAAALRELLRS